MQSIKNNISYVSSRRGRVANDTLIKTAFKISLHRMNAE